MGIEAPLPGYRGAMRAWGIVAGEPPGEQGSHVCWLFDAADGFRDAAVQFLAEGDRRGERLLYVADRPSSDELCAELAELGDIDRRIADGSLSAMPLREFTDHGRRFDGPGQIERYRELTMAAERDGYQGLRLVADATALVPVDDSRRHFVDFELAVDALMAELSFSALCAYDRSVLGPDAVELSVVHPQRRVPPSDDPGFSLFRDGDGAFRLAGEVDVRSRELFSTALESVAAVAGNEVVLDLGDLGFVDVAGLTRLWRWAEELTFSGRQLRLERVPGIVKRCCAHLGFDALLGEVKGVSVG